MSTGLTNVTCRYRDCGEPSPRPMSIKDGADWLMSHGSQAHGEPYVGGKWTAAREPANEPELEMGG